MGTKITKIENEILRQSSNKPIVWKRSIDDVFSMGDTRRNKIEEFILKANSFYPSIKFTAEISETETTFLETIAHKGGDSTRSLSLTREYITNLQSRFNTRISIRVICQVSRKASSR